MKIFTLKGVVLVAVMVAAGLALTGCMGMGSGGEVPTETPIVLTDPAALPAEIAKVTGDDKAADPYGLKGLDQYYIPKTFPDGAKLKDIRVSPSVVRVSYTFGATKENSYDNQMEIAWYRKLEGAQYMTNVGTSGSQYKELASPDGVRYLTTTAKAQSPTDSASSFDYCRIVHWSQDGKAFLAAVPVGFTDEDVLKYCVAQQVQVK